jgi:hypothetical protein
LQICDPLASHASLARAATRLRGYCAGVLCV